MASCGVSCQCLQVGILCLPKLPASQSIVRRMIASVLPSDLLVCHHGGQATQLFHPFDMIHFPAAPMIDIPPNTQEYNIIREGLLLGWVGAQF